MLMIVYAKKIYLYIKLSNFIQSIKREKKRIYYKIYRNVYKKGERSSIVILQFMYVIDKIIIYLKIGGIEYEKSNYWSNHSHCTCGCCGYWNFGSQRV